MYIQRLLSCINTVIDAMYFFEKKYRKVHETLKKYIILFLASLTSQADPVVTVTACASYFVLSVGFHGF